MMPETDDSTQAASYEPSCTRRDRKKRSVSMSTKEIIDLSKHRVLRVIYYFKAISSGCLIFSKTRTYGLLRDYYNWEEVKLI